MASAHTIPSPPAFLDPLTDLSDSYFYATPKFFPMDHPNTRWLVTMIRNCLLDKVKRKMELQPGVFRTSYFQLLDHPQLYKAEDATAQPLFHRQAVLYLTVIGTALYLKSTEMVKLLLEYRDPSQDKLYNVTDPQYATHIQETIIGDFHAYPMSVIMLRGGYYEYATDLLVAGWDPNEPICMPARRRYERRAFYYLDWLDYTLSLLQERPLLPLARLVSRLIADPSLYTSKRLPITAIKPESEDDRVPTGLIDVDDLPSEARMTGVKSLLEIAQDYSAYLQAKDRHQQIRDCVRQMVCEGVNPQIMMAHAADYDGYEQASEGEVVQSVSNANNNAAAAAAHKRTAKANEKETPYISEPTRILLHALQSGARASNKAPLIPLLDAVAVYVRRYFYLMNPPIIRKSEKISNTDRKSLQKRFGLTKRDAKNAIVLLLNIMQQQFASLDRLNQAQREKKHPKYRHLDTSKQANNKRVSLMRNVKRIASTLFHVLLHSGELLDFVEAQFPPYDRNEVDFPVSPGLEYRMPNIQLDVMATFNTSKAAPSYLNKEAMQRVQGMKKLYLNLHVGKAPSNDKLESEKGNMPRKRGKRNVNNASSYGANASSTATGDCRRKNSPSTDERCYLLCAGESPQCDPTAEPGGHVTFVKVKRRHAKRKNADEDEKAAGQDDECGEPAQAETSTQIAARVSEQIEQLRRSGVGADAALSEIYQRILDELSRSAAEAAAAEDQKKPPPTEKDAEEGENAGESQQEEEAAVEKEGSSDITSTSGDGRRGIKRGGRWRCRARKRRGHNHHHQQHCYQKARVYDAPPEGTEFDLHSA